MDKIGSVSFVSTSAPSQTGAAGGVSDLEIGTQLTGQVLEAKDGQLILNVNGQTLTAESFVPLSPGDVLQLEFGGLTDGLITLRLLNLDRSLAFTPMTFEDLAAQLANLKLPANETTAELAKSMMEFGIPLTKENVLELLKAINGKPDDATMQAASFLKSAEIPLTPENLKALANFFQQKPEIGTYLSQLQNYMALTSGSDGRLGQLLSMLPGVLGEYLLEPKKEAKKKNMDRIEQLASLAGLKKKGSSDPLTTLLEELKNEIEKSPKKETLQSLLTTLSRVEEFVHSEHLLNADNRSESYVYFQVPLKSIGENVTAQIRIQYEKTPEGKRIINPERTKLEFSVTTSHLGTVQCNLNLLKRNIRAKLFVDETRESFVGSHLGWLKEAIEKLDYRMASMKVSSQPSEFWPMPKVEWKSMEKVNVKV